MEPAFVKSNCGGTYQVLSPPSLISIVFVKVAESRGDVLSFGDFNQ